jgi:cardiolipin synthase A/B
VEFLTLPTVSAVVVAAVTVAAVVFGVVVAPRDRAPSSALAWILLMILAPVFGVLLFLVFGYAMLPTHRRQAQQRMDELIRHAPVDVVGADTSPEVPAWLPSVARLNRATGAMPMLDGNSARFFRTFDDQVEALVTAVDTAERYVHVEFYILSVDASTQPFFDALERAVRRGVMVRVLLDHLGSRPYPGYAATVDLLDRIDVQWHLLLPVKPLRGRYQRPDLRNHRKLLIVDGTVGYVGSLNMIDPSYDKPANQSRHLRWRDLLVEVRGPVVREVEAVFATDWFGESGELLEYSKAPTLPEHRRSANLLAQIVPSGPAFSTENNLAMFTSLIAYAQHRLSITSPYFVPDPSLLAAIVTAARRGVAVELFVGAIGDQFLVFHAQHSYYQVLLEAGVRIFLYPAPSILHSKHISVDDYVAAVGSSNMDIRSLQLNFEIMLLIGGRSFTDDLRLVEDENRRVSRELTLAEWSHRGAAHRLIDDWARLTSAVQ